MYISVVTDAGVNGAVSSQMTTELAGILLHREMDVDGLELLFKTLWACISHILHVAWSWSAYTLPSLLLHAFQISATWTFQALFDAWHFVRIHPHPFHTLGWAIFFGPIILLIPCLLLLELLILVLFHLSFLSHGMMSDSIEDRFDSLKEYFMETRESIFATIELWTAMFNAWTTEYPPLLILRLLAGGMSLCILFGIWSGW